MVRPKQQKRDLRFGTWNIRSLYRTGSLTAAGRELARYKLDLVGVQGSVPLTQYCSGDKIEKNEMGGACSTYGARRGVCRVLVGKPEERDHLEDSDVDWKIILRRIFRKWDVEAWIGSSWLRIGTCDGHLRMR